MAMAEEGSEAGGVGGLENISTLFLASICQAKEHIEHLEVFFSRTLYPAVLKEAEFRWEEERTSLLEQIRLAEEERVAARCDREAIMRKWEAAEYSWQQEREGFDVERREMQSRLEKAENEKQKALAEVDGLNDAILTLKRTRDALEENIKGRKLAMRSLSSRYLTVKMQYESLCRQQDVFAGMKSLETERQDGEFEILASQGTAQREERIVRVDEVSQHAARHASPDRASVVPAADHMQFAVNSGFETSGGVFGNDRKLAVDNTDHHCGRETAGVSKGGLVAFEDEETCQEETCGEVPETCHFRHEVRLSPVKQQTPASPATRTAAAKARLNVTTTPQSAKVKVNKKGATLKDFFSGTKPNGLWRTTRAENKSRDPHDDFLSTPQERALQRIAEENARNRKPDSSPQRDQLPKAAGENSKKRKLSLSAEEPAGESSRARKLSLEKGQSRAIFTTNEYRDQPAEPASPVPDFVPDTLGPDCWDNVAPAEDEDDEETQQCPDDCLEKQPEAEEKQLVSDLPKDNAWVMAGGGRSKQSGAKYKYNEPVRKKADREALLGAECRQCKKFYDAVLPVDDQGRRQCDHHKEVSRHRYRYVPPATPEGFWNIGFSEV